MPLQRTELRDELAALLAASRELPPDHDEALADVFVDRVASRISSMPVPARRESAPSLWARSRRYVGAAVLGLACLGGASLLSVNHTQVGPSSVQAHAVPKLVPMPGMRKMPEMPPGPKALAGPQAHALKP